jgi:hypothetical protein
MQSLTSVVRRIAPLAFVLFGLCLLVSQARSQQDDPNLLVRTLPEQQLPEAVGSKCAILCLSEKQLQHSYPELSGLKPAETQQDLPKLLEKIGANETLLLAIIPNLSSQEDVAQEEMHRDVGGRVRGFPVFTGRYSYLVLAHTEEDGIHLREYRVDPKGKNTRPGMAGNSSLTQGFALLPLHFHPFHQAAAKFRYLGRQNVDHQNTYVVAFVQQPEKATLTGIINVGGVVVPVAYQGIAWIEPDNFEIVRMRTDLLEPKPEIGLRAQTTEVRFSQVRLPTLAAPLWLPHDVVVTSAANGNVFRNKHRYSDYKKFVAESKILPATGPPEEKQK